MEGPTSGPEDRRITRPQTLPPLYPIIYLPTSAYERWSPLHPPKPMIGILWIYNLW